MKFIILLSLLTTVLSDSVVKFNSYDTTTIETIKTLPFEDRVLISHLRDEDIDSIKFIHNKVPEQLLGKLHRRQAKLTNTNCRSLFFTDIENNVMAISRCSPK